MGDNPTNPNPYGKTYSEVPPAARLASPGWSSSRPDILLNKGIVTRGALKAVNKQVDDYNAESDRVVGRIHAEANARQAQAVADSRYCGAAGCVRKVGERLFGKTKTAGRRRRHRNKKGKKTLKRRR